METLELPLELYDLVSDPEIRRAGAKTLKGFCLTYLAHHFSSDLSDFFDEMADALQDHDARRLEIIGFRGCSKSTMASLALVLWAALEHPDRYPFVIMLADTRGLVPRQRPALGRRAHRGNWLHTDGLMARLKNTGIFRVLEFPLLREGIGTEIERCTWKAKYPTQEAIDQKRQELGDIGFRREMLLQVVPEKGQDVLAEDITYYDEPPFDDGNHLAHGVWLSQPRRAPTTPRS